MQYTIYLSQSSNTSFLSRPVQLSAGGVPGIAQQGIALSRLTHLVNALLVASLFWLGAISFKKVRKPSAQRSTVHLRPCCRKSRSKVCCAHSIQLLPRLAVQVLTAKDEGKEGAQLAFVFQVRHWVMS